MTEDFCHEKSFTAKVTATTNRSTLKLKESIVNNKEKTGAQFVDEVKLWFDLPSRGSLFTKVKSTNYIKVQYDHGLRSYRGNLFYVFGGINADKFINNVNFRIGLGHIAENVNSENRLKVNLVKDKNQYFWYHKTYLAYKRARFGVMTVFDLNNCVLQKNNLLFGFYYNSNSSVFLRAEVNKFRGHNPNFKNPSTIFDKVIADFTHKINSKSKVALEVYFYLNLDNFRSSN